MTLSASGSSLAVDDDVWVLGGGGRGVQPVDEASLVGVLPLLERDPSETIAAIAALEGHPFHSSP